MATPSQRRASIPSSRPPLHRMQVLHERLLSGAYPNCRSLAADLEVSAKTIQRDIEFLRDRLGYPIAYDRAHLGFYYTGPVPDLPGFEVSAGELVALFVAQKALEQFRGTSFARQLAASFERLTRNLAEKFTFSWTDLDAGISFHKLGTTEEDLRVFNEISRAVFENRELAFEYRKLDSQTFAARRVQPYHLGSIENQWYVIGWDLQRRQLRTFALTRLRKPRVLTARFQRPEDFSIEAHLGGSFGVFAGPNRYLVRLRFSGAAAQLVAERQWHSSQKITSAENGALELSLELCSLREIERWILSWGPRVQVLAPPELVARVRASIDAMAKMPRD